MGLDIKKILDDLNPSEKVMKWLIVILIAGVTIVFGWGINKGKSTQEIETLQKNYKELVIKVDNLQKNTPRAIEAEISNEIKDVKIVVFKEIDDLEAELTDKITLVVSSQGEVTKEWLLKAIDMRDRQPSNNFRLYASSEVKPLTFTSYNIMEKTDEVKPELMVEIVEDTIELTAEEHMLVDESVSEDTVYFETELEFGERLDTIKKKFFLFKLFNKKDK